MFPHRNKYAVHTSGEEFYGRDFLANKQYLSRICSVSRKKSTIK